MRFNSLPPTEAQKAKIVELHDQNMGHRDIVKATGVSRYYVMLTLNQAGRCNGSLGGGPKKEKVKEGYFNWNHKDFAMYR